MTYFVVLNVVSLLLLPETEGSKRQDRTEILYEGPKLEIWEIEDLRLQDQQQEEKITRQHNTSSDPQTRRRNSAGRKDRRPGDDRRSAGSAARGGPDIILVVALCFMLEEYVFK